MDRVIINAKSGVKELFQPLEKRRHHEIKLSPRLRQAQADSIIEEKENRR